MELPLFPLNTVLLPGGVLPLRIFEPRYLDMISACMRRDSGFGVCLLKGGRETGVPSDYHETGTLAKIIDWETLPDGLLGVTASAESKVHITDSRLEPNRLLVGEVEVLEQETDAPMPEEFAWLGEFLSNIVPELGSPYDKLIARYDSAAWVGGRLTELLPVDLTLKQTLLELDDPLERLSCLGRLVTRN